MRDENLARAAFIMTMKGAAARFAGGLTTGLVLLTGTVLWFVLRDPIAAASALDDGGLATLLVEAGCALAQRLLELLGLA
jgi:hypothetical protein